MWSRHLSRAALASVLALGLGLLGLTEGAEVGAAWWDEQQVGEGVRLQAGNVDLQPGAHSIQLHSRQPADSRVFASTTTCTVPTGFTTCRVVTTTLPNERLVGGDRLQVRSSFTLAALGTNLRGTVWADTTAMLPAPTSPFQAAVTTSARLDGPTGCSATGARPTCPVDLAAGVGPGAYEVVVDLTSPVDDGGRPWRAAHLDQALTIGSLATGFTQGDR